jgi:hypothetical protein
MWSCSPQVGRKIGNASLRIPLSPPLFMRLITRIPGYPSDPDIGDPEANMWAFGLIHHSVTESAHWSLFTDIIFYPREGRSHDPTGGGSGTLAPSINSPCSMAHTEILQGLAESGLMHVKTERFQIIGGSAYHKSRGTL